MWLNVNLRNMQISMLVMGQKNAMSQMKKKDQIRVYHAILIIQLDIYSRIYENKQQFILQTATVQPHCRHFWH